jgi:site-specific recombinase XerD
MDLIGDIEEYVTKHRPYVSGENSLFVAHKQQNKGKSITKSAIHAIFARCSQETGVYCTPHWLRHTYATELKEAGVDDYISSLLLGHSAEYTKRIYTHLSPQFVKAMLERTLYKKRGSDDHES